jgi:hypothetical protein
MAVDSSIPNLQMVSLDLQEVLRSHFSDAAPIQVFCIHLRHKLLVLVQHSPRAMPDPPQVAQVVQRRLEEQEAIQPWLAQTANAQMELFLRVTGDNQVYASGVFDLASGSLIAVAETAVTPGIAAATGDFDVPSSNLAGSAMREGAIAPAIEEFGVFAPAPLPTPLPTDEVSPVSEAIALPEVAQVDPPELESSVDAQPSGEIPSPEISLVEQPAVNPEPSASVRDALSLDSPPLDSPPLDSPTQVPPLGAPGNLPPETPAGSTETPTSASSPADLGTPNPEPVPEPMSASAADPAAELGPASQAIAPGALVLRSESESLTLEGRSPEAQALVPLPEPPATPASAGARRQRWIALGVISGVLLATATYALSRPCVLGECENLDQAQALERSASEVLQDPQSPQDVVDAYDQLVDASYLLQQIPPWSGAYREAQGLLHEYDGKMGVLSDVVQAQRQAYTAALKSQDPPHPVDTWREIRILWQEAIALLNAVPANSNIYPLAQQKLAEYEANLAAIDTRIATERAAQAKVQSAREAAAVAEARQGVASSREAWQQTYATWQTAIKLLQEVPANTMSQGEAQQLLEIYQAKLGATRDRLQQEEIAQSSYQEAIALAEQATVAEAEQQWSQAVIGWRDALNQAQQVPQGTTYYDQAQPLISNYRQALAAAEEKLREAVGRQEAANQLANLCATSNQCTYRRSGDRLQVQVTQANVGRGAFPLPGMHSPISEPFNNLLRAVANIGDRAQVKVDVFNTDGSLFGTYTPDVNGYVPPSNGDTPEPFRF